MQIVKTKAYEFNDLEINSILHVYDLLRHDTKVIENLFEKQLMVSALVLFRPNTDFVLQFSQKSYQHVFCIGQFRHNTSIIHVDPHYHGYTMWAEGDNASIDIEEFKDLYKSKIYELELEYAYCMRKNNDGIWLDYCNQNGILFTKEGYLLTEIVG